MYEKLKAYAGPLQGLILIYIYFICAGTDVVMDYGLEDPGTVKCNTDCADRGPGQGLPKTSQKLQYCLFHFKKEFYNNSIKLNSKTGVLYKQGIGLPLAAEGW